MIYFVKGHSYSAKSDHPFKEIPWVTKDCFWVFGALIYFYEHRLYITYQCFFKHSSKISHLHSFKTIIL